MEREYYPKLFLDTYDVLLHKAHYNESFIRLYMLATMACAVQAYKCIESPWQENKYVNLNIVAIGIGPSSLKKSPLLNDLTKGFRRFVDSKEALSIQVIDQYEIEWNAFIQAKAEASKAIKKGGSPKTPIRPDRPNAYRNIGKEMTKNGLLDSFDFTSQLCIINGEAGGLVNGHAFQKQQIYNTISNITDLLENDSVDYKTGPKHYQVKNRAFSIILGIQREMVANLIENKGAQGQGLLNRAVMVEVTDIEKNYIVDHGYSTSDTNAWNLYLEKHWNQLLPLKPDSLIEIEPKTLEYEKGVRDYLIKKVNEIVSVNDGDQVYRNKCGAMMTKFTGISAAFDMRKNVTERDVNFAYDNYMFFYNFRENIDNQKTYTPFGELIEKAIIYLKSKPNEKVHDSIIQNLPWCRRSPAKRIKYRLDELYPNVISNEPKISFDPSTRYLCYNEAVEEAKDMTADEILEHLDEVKKQRG